MNIARNDQDTDKDDALWKEVGLGHLEGLELSQRPVWIWDLTSERIEWGNAAALAFWHVPDIETLRPSSEIRSVAARKRVAAYGDRVAAGEVVDEDWTMYPGGKPISARIIVSGCRFRGKKALLCEAVEGVTATKEAGAYALRAFAETFHVSPIAEIVCNTDGRIRFLNPAAMEAFGVMAGARFIDIADASAASELEHIMKVQVSQPYRTKDVKFGADTDARWWRIVAQAGKDTTTGEDAVYLYLLDVTAEREAAQAVLAQEKMFAMAFNALPLGFSLKDADARYIFVNEFLERLFGKKRQEIVGKIITEVACFDGVDEALEADLEALRTGRSSRVQEVHPIDGKMCHILRGREVVDGLDGRNWLLSFGLDVTDQVLAQEDLQSEKDFVQAVLDTAPILVFTRRRNGEFGFVNQAAKHFLNDKPTPILGMDPLGAGREDDPGAAIDSVYDLVEQRQDRVTTETVYRTEAGEERSFRTTSLPLNRSKGDLEVLSVSVDITELRQARMVAERANEAKNGFLAAISHEIRTPLNGVLGIARLLEDTKLDRDQEQMVQTVQESGQHLLSLINDILDFSKIEAGAVTLEEESFDLHSSLAYIADILSPRAQQANIDVLFTVDGAVPRGLTGDLGRVRQILVNLIGNSIKFTKQGGVHLSVDVEERKDELVRLRFAVTDTGIGIPEAALPTLFDPFTQVDSSATRRYEGAGLGLAICMRLATLMNGELDVVSKLGSGSTFTVILPFIVTESAAGRDMNLENPLDGLHVNIVGFSPLAAKALSGQVLGWAGRPAVFGSVAEVPDPAASDLMIMPEAVARTANGGAAAERCPTLLLLDWAESQANISTSGFDTLRRPISPLKLAGAIRRALAAGGTIEPDDDDYQMQEDAEKLASDTASALQILAEKKNKSLRILIAEDNNVNQYVIGQMVRNVGHTADIVGNGLEAVQAAASLPYDVILMDVRMPEMDGIEATAKIRQLPLPAGKIPIIAMTGDVLQETVDACYKAGMDGYIAKPFDRDVLMTELANLVGSGRISSTQTMSPTLPIADEIDEEMVFEMLQVLGSEDYMRLLDQTVVRTKTVIEDMRRAAAVRGTDELVQKAHALQSSLGHLGLKHARDVCLFIEQNAPRRDMSEISAEIDKLGEVVERGVSRIKSDH
ncbi:ATP-binding protein [Hwanghaeella sp.]|uniref:ATP-binding protein n=1 Tax=Hwanghaeella sp. TaxID=2605943 RepID=UPI003CCBD13D